MSRFAIAAATLAIAMAASAPTPSLAAPGHQCVRAGGSADMITRDLAEFMAKAALKNSIAGMGAKPVGQITLSCKDSVPVHCLARQKACK